MADALDATPRVPRRPRPRAQNGLVARVTDSSALKRVQRLEHDDELDENDDGLNDRCDKARALALKAAARVDAMAKKYSLRDNHHSFAL